MASTSRTGSRKRDGQFTETPAAASWSSVVLLPTTIYRRGFPDFFARSGPAAVSAQQSNSGGGGEQPLGLPAATSQEPREVVPATPGTAASAPAQAQAGDDRNSAEGAAGTTPVQQSGQENGAEAAESSPAAPVPLTWHVRETVNFRIYYTDPTYVEKAAEAAEAIRSLQARRWGSSAAHVAWSPPCDIYLYPTSKDFARLTGQPDTSPGFSTMGVNGTRVVGRRVNLRADHPQLLTAILPHEVTHVVLADLFTQQQIPRWADEGMAVLAEPKAEQVSRASELNDPLREGRVFKLSELMAIDYPSADAWNLYYAQSVSLTSFLVELGTPEEVRTLRPQRPAQGHRGCAPRILSHQWLLRARKPLAELRSPPGRRDRDLESRYLDNAEWHQTRVKNDCRGNDIGVIDCRQALREALLDRRRLEANLNIHDDVPVCIEMHPPARPRRVEACPDRGGRRKHQTQPFILTLARESAHDQWPPAALRIAVDRLGAAAKNG